MDIKSCLELGKECGLQTVGECIDNVEIHSMSLFIYDTIPKELGELYEDLKIFHEDMDYKDIQDTLKLSTTDALRYLK